MTQATTIAVLKIQLLYGILYTTNGPSTNTSTAFDTPSIKVDIVRTTPSLCKFLEFLLILNSMRYTRHQSKYLVQQNNRWFDITRRIYTYTCIHTANTQQNTPMTTTSGQVFNTINIENRNREKDRYILAPLRLMSTYIQICIIHPITLVTT